MRDKIVFSAQEAARAALLLQQEEVVTFIEHVSALIIDCYRKGGKLLIAGNGGSLCDAAHFAEELTGVYRRTRPALGALALADPAHMSCVANDLGYPYVFSRAIEALGRPHDVVILLTTSGNSPNLMEAARAAQQQKLSLVTFLGKTGGALKGMGDLEWIVQGFPYSDRIQEAHMAAIHIIIEIVEHELFGSP